MVDKAFVMGFFAGVAFIAPVLYLVVIQSSARVRDMQGFLAMSGYRVAPVAPGGRQAADLKPERPADDVVPERILKIAALFPGEATRIVRDAKAERQRGTEWAKIVQDLEAYLSMQDPAVVQLLDRDPTWGG